MKYCLGDKFVLEGIECIVNYINNGRAYLFPESDGEIYNGQKTYKSLAFAIINEKGIDKLGNKVYTIIKHECGAV